MGDKAKHTPGPWRHDKAVEGCIVSESTNDHVVCLGHDYDEYGIIPDDADGALIAAAPDLRASVEEFLSLREWVILAGGARGALAQDVIQKFAEMQSGVVERARLALAKAVSR